MVMAIFRIWWVNCWPCIHAASLLNMNLTIFIFLRKQSSFWPTLAYLYIGSIRLLHFRISFRFFPFFFFFFYRKIILHHGGVMSTLDREFTGSWDKWFHTLVIDQLLKSNTQSVVPEFLLTNTWKSSYHSFVMSVFI